MFRGDTQLEVISVLATCGADQAQATNALIRYIEAKQKKGKSAQQIIAKMEDLERRYKFDSSLYEAFHTARRKTGLRRSNVIPPIRRVRRDSNGVERYEAVEYSPERDEAVERPAPVPSEVQPLAGPSKPQPCDCRPYPRRGTGSSRESTTTPVVPPDIQVETPRPFHPQASPPQLSARRGTTSSRDSTLPLPPSPPQPSSSRPSSSSAARPSSTRTRSELDTPRSFMPTPALTDTSSPPQSILLATPSFVGHDPSPQQTDRGERKWHNWTALGQSPNLPASSSGYAQSPPPTTTAGAGPASSKSRRRSSNMSNLALPPSFLADSDPARLGQVVPATPRSLMGLTHERGPLNGRSGLESWTPPAPMPVPVPGPGGSGARVRPLPVPPQKKGNAPSLAPLTPISSASMGEDEHGHAAELSKGSSLSAPPVMLQGPGRGRSGTLDAGVGGYQASVQEEEGMRRHAARRSM